MVRNSPDDSPGLSSILLPLLTLEIVIKMPRGMGWVILSVHPFSITKEIINYFSVMVPVYQWKLLV